MSCIAFLKKTLSKFLDKIWEIEWKKTNMKNKLECQLLLSNKLIK
jgi:hypothetical protein